ncbi:MAG: hypothetical protein ISQ34_04255 [Rickettsiales bacterium]|nr:hypothetical protein [Rickettsiales bacterium]
MTFISLPMGSLTLDKNNLLRGDAARFAVSSLLYSKIYRSARRSGHSRSKARKLANRRRRYFVDNIIMHHKRIHDHNRKLVVSSARDRAVARKKEMEHAVRNKELKKTAQKSRYEHQRWTQKPDIKARSMEIRNRLQTKRARTDSRWAALIESQGS